MSGENVFDDDDMEQDELEQDVAEDLRSDADRERFKSKVEYVEDFIQRLRLLIENTSRLRRIES
jgi:hypothetical protein